MIWSTELLVGELIFPSVGIFVFLEAWLIVINECFFLFSIEYGS